MTETSDTMICNIMEYFICKVETTADWKQLYNALEAEAVNMQEEEECLILTKAKKILTKNNLMHLWTPENIRRIMSSVKDKMLDSAMPSFFVF